MEYLNEFPGTGLDLTAGTGKKGLSIEVVMEATKISRINVLALESGDRSALPHPVYTKGFVKSYARFLGLDSDELSMAVDREFQEEAEEAEEVEEVVPMARQPFPVADSSSEKTFNLADSFNTFGVNWWWHQSFHRFY